MNERRRQNVLARASVEHEEVSVAARLREQFAMHAVIHVVEQYRRLHRVPVVRVVRRGLEVPVQLARVGIQRHDGARIEVVSFTDITVQHGIRIPDAPVKLV